MAGSITDERSSGHVDFRDPEPFSLKARGQSLTFLPAGHDRFAALISLIENARSSLKLAYYMYREDRVGRKVRDALVAAARRGVDVHLIVDGFGAETSEDFFVELRDAGGHFAKFIAKWSRRYLIRNHQKIAIADGERALVGGFNIGESYFAPPEDDGWHDLGLMIEGSAVDELLRWYGELEDWVATPKAQFRAISRKVKEWDPGDGPVQLLVGGPTRGLSSWARSVGRDLKRGRRLDMVMAYFSPSAGMLRRIGRIAQRGEARLIMAGRSDNGATIGATRSLYHYLLKTGAAVWEFRPSKLHMKLIVLDDTVYIGSANFDMRSLYLNLELMLRIEDAALACRMREFVTLHHGVSKRITPESHKRKANLFNRIRWNLSWFLVAVLDYTVSRRLNLGL